MKKAASIIFFVASVIYSDNIFSQCSISAGINNTTTDSLSITSGTTVMLVSTNSCDSMIMSDNFNSGRPGPLWDSLCNPSFSNPCGSGADGTSCLWVGDSSFFPRDLITKPVNILTGSVQVCFDLRLAIQGQNSPCEGPDENDEGIELQYSTDNVTWQSMIYFRPDGRLFPRNQWIGQGISVGSGNTEFTAWHNYCFTVPPGGMSDSTRFRWHQEQVTDYAYDHWGIDNVSIKMALSQIITWTSSPSQLGFPYTGSNTPFFAPNLGISIYTAHMIDTLHPGITASDTVIVYTGFPTSAFSVLPMICIDENETIQYYGTAGPRAIFNWDFDGGTTVSGSGRGPYQIHWSTAGIYHISLTVQDSILSSAQTTEAVTVNQQPLTVILYDSICQGQFYTLPDGSNVNAAGIYYDTIPYYHRCDSLFEIHLSVYPIPPSPVITQNGNILNSNATNGNQWYDQNGIINGATGQEYTILTSGNYYVILTENGCSSDTSNSINVVLYWIEENDHGRLIKVYPNPVNDELIIEEENNLKEIRFEIENTLGQLVYKGMFAGKTIIPAASFSPGVYIVKIEAGKASEFKKIVKKQE